MSNLGIAGFDLYRTRSNAPAIYSNTPNARYQPKRPKKIKNKKRKSRR